MMSVLVLTAAASSSVAAFRADFPSATLTESPAGGRLTSASGFEARGLGADPEGAARAFLDRYGAAFGIAGRQKLALGDAAESGEPPRRVRFERRIDGLPVFDGDVVLAVDAANAVILVNTSDVPPNTSGQFRISKQSAIRAALKALKNPKTSDPPRAVRGWKAVGSALRPVWRVDVAAEQPPGEWRSFVDAQTGKVVLRRDLRTTAGH